MQRAHGATGVCAVAHLADRAECAVEAELVGDLLDDLLQRRRDDEHRFAALAMLLDEMQRLGIDERPQHRLHRIRDERAHVVGPEAAQELQPVFGRAPHHLVVRAPEDEQQLPRGRVRELPPRDQPAVAERARERERRRTAEQRPVEIEKRRSRHAA